MKISFIPQLRAAPVAVSVIGDTITINGTAYDFTPLAEGAVLPAEAAGCDLIVSNVTRIEGEIALTLVLPHGSDAPEAARFPQPIHVTENGPVTLPGSEVKP